MKLHTLASITLSVGTLIFAHAASGGEVTSKGTACWAGASNHLGISDKDFGGTWALEGTWVDPANEAESAYFKCVGFYFTAAGEGESTPWTCHFRYADESTMLMRANSKGNGPAAGKVTSGTGRLEGVTGKFDGGVVTQVGKAPQGKFAGCREGTLTMSVKESG